MKTQTSLVASKVRMQQWAEMIRECQSRPSDMKIEQWCKEYGITKANYYYRLRRVRESLLDSLPDQGSSFVELPIKEDVRCCNNEKIIETDTVAIIHGTNGIEIELRSNASADFISILLGAIANVK